MRLAIFIQGVFLVREDLLEHLRPSVCPWAQKIWINCTASQTHITIHIPKPHDKYYPLTPRDDNDKYTRKNKDKDKQSGQWGSED